MYQSRYNLFCILKCISIQIQLALKLYTLYTRTSTVAIQIHLDHKLYTWELSMSKSKKQRFIFNLTIFWYNNPIIRWGDYNDTGIFRLQDMGFITVFITYTLSSYIKSKLAELRDHKVVSIMLHTFHPLLCNWETVQNWSN